ncbi:MAG: HAD family hydrolase [bacterium]|nr:HAD family hydrolase [bacterium]
MIKGIIFDFGYTIYDPDKQSLLPEVLALLEKLKGKFKLALISRTADPEKRLQQIEELGLNKWFEAVAVTPKGENKDLEQFLEKLKLSPEETLVVGDRVDSEIRQGNLLGMQTAHFNYGPRQEIKPQSEAEKAKFEINNLAEIENLIL